jgi:hypothetical protein
MAHQVVSRPALCSCPLSHPPPPLPSVSFQCGLGAGVAGFRLGEEACVLARAQPLFGCIRVTPSAALQRSMRLVFKPPLVAETSPDLSAQFFFDGA